MTFQISITTGGSVPIYRQITDQVRLAVATGGLAADDRLPSVRSQAQLLLINPNTVARAYNDLVREGVLRSEQGRGLFVAARRSVYKKAERQRRLKPALDAFVHEALALDFGVAEIRGALEKKIAQMKLNLPRAGGTDDE